MLKDIKSKFLIQYVFSLLDQKRKFKLVENNKSLQNKLDIKLIDYKQLSGKYIIYEEIGKGKEYNYKGEIEFEGKYLKGVKNGKGKEYFKNGKLKFEGEYLNGKRLNGNGYDTNNKIIYELKNGKGYAKEYNYKGEIEFEGEYLDGEKNGKGKEYYCSADYSNSEEEYY